MQKNRLAPHLGSLLGTLSVLATLSIGCNGSTQEDEPSDSTAHTTGGTSSSSTGGRTSLASGGAHATSTGGSVVTSRSGSFSASTGGNAPTRGGSSATSEGGTNSASIGGGTAMSEGGTFSTGGAASSSTGGKSVSTGGGTATAKGGTPSTGGAASSSTGGRSASTGGGTATAKGGTPSTGGSATATGGASTATGGSPSSASSIEFAPYFYTWGWGNTVYPFTSLVDLKAKSQIKSVTLAFVLSDGQCAATTDIQDHQSDVTAFQAQGGHVKASFGGANGTYLENACTSAQSLADAISGFVTQTGITDLDFDVEQAGAMDATVNARRAQALKLVQDAKGISVSYTLAATPRDKWGTLGGMSAASLAVLRATLDANVKVTRVNLMTMDYGAYFSSGNTMGDLAVSALTDAKSQLLSLVAGLSDANAWHMLGATPMIGQNDVSTEIFTLADARTLVAFAKANSIGLVSFWAINRDQPCPYNDLGVCSQVNTTNFEFSDIFRGVE